MRYIKAVIICIFLILPFLNSERAYGMTDIRVGLLTNYKDAKIVTVYNNDIKFGYCIADKFATECSFYSSSGFSFEPDSDAYYSLRDEFSTYLEVCNEVAVLASYGLKAHPVSVYRGKWKIYIEEDSYESLEYEIRDAIKDKVTLMKDNKYLVRMLFADSSMLIDGSVYKTFPQIKSGSSSVIKLGTRSYRGRIEIGRFAKSTLTVVNILNIEAYLLGVVPCEMNSSWHIEALKAQAVCARSYATSVAGFGASCNIEKPYILTDTSATQVYGGFNYETDATYKAVKSTMGEVIKSRGNIISAFYFSTSGGATEYGSDVWGIKGNNYLSVSDDYETSPEKKPWLYGFSFDEIEAVLNKEGFEIEDINDIYPETVTSSGRIYTLVIKSKQKTLRISGTKFRSIFELPSTKFTVNIGGNEADRVYVRYKAGDKEIDLSNAYVISDKKDVSLISQSAEQYIVKNGHTLWGILNKTANDKNTVIFAGMGSGHGVGMSQSGAYGMARAGFDYKEILHYYFNNIVIDNYA